MVLEFIDILSNKECNFFLEKIKGKKPNSIFAKNGTINFYNRYKVQNLNVQNKLEKFLYDRFNIKYSLINDHFWVNEITPLTNKKDSYHLDDFPLTIVSYLNDNFEGGEFEYLDGDNKKIILPVKNRSIIMSGDIKHRTLPVSTGIRYSLVAGFNLPIKKSTSLF